MHRFIFPVNSFRNRRIAKRCSFYIPLKLSHLRSKFNFLYPLETSENHRFLMFSRGIKGNIYPK